MDSLTVLAETGSNSSGSTRLGGDTVAETVNGYATDFSSISVQEAVLIAGHARKIHPVKNYIESCWEKWKKAGGPRGHIESLAAKYMQTPDTIFHRESSYILCLAAVARIYEPGCKYDQITILEGATGAGKSTFWKMLSGEFFGEFRVHLDDLGRTIETMRGRWFLEMAEMAKAKGDNAVYKDFLSSGVDTHRLAYARRVVSFPRQSVMVGTTNEYDHLTDPTSVRRNWIWRTPLHELKQFDRDELLRCLPLIWGEATKPISTSVRPSPRVNCTSGCGHARRSSNNARSPRAAARLRPPRRSLG